MSDLHIYGGDLATDIANTLTLSHNLQESGVKSGNMANRQQEDALAVGQNGGLATDANEEDMEDVDDDELEDDMMDKISSSPSIEDGWYSMKSNTFPIPPPLASTKPGDCSATQPGKDQTEQAQPGGSPLEMCSCDLARPPHCCTNSPSKVGSVNTVPTRVSGDSQACKAPVVFTSEIFPHQHRRQHRRYSSTDTRATEPDKSDKNSNLLGIVENAIVGTCPCVAAVYDDGDTLFNISEALVVSDTTICSAKTALATMPEQWAVSDDIFDEMMIPYYNEDDENDDDDYENDMNDIGDGGDGGDGDDGANNGAGTSFTRDIDSRFVVSGWGSECLHNIEDIDFEFVYALHTFMATVEGQANATKGDTMVLLDDSNSYWWLVRVVKDSSIGKLAPFLFFSTSGKQRRCATYGMRQQ